MSVTAKGPVKSTYYERLLLSVTLKAEAATLERAIVMAGPYEEVAARVNRPRIEALLRAADVILEKRR